MATLQKLMKTPTHAEVRDAVAAFALPGTLTELHPLPRGHIHDTYLSEWTDEGTRHAFIHQRLNQEVFPNVELLMANVRRVSEHLVRKLEANDTGGFEPLNLIPTTLGENYANTPSGAWRTFVFIRNTSSYDRCSGPNQAFEAGRAFGWFQAQMRDLPAGELGETLPQYFSSPYRYQQFQAALESADHGRKSTAWEAIEFARQRETMVAVIARELDRGALPTRVVHGDTKLNNILFDDTTGKAKGIVDLDTCMAGYSLYDFGDLVRFTAATSAEDEQDLTRVGTDLELYRALAEGYLSAAGEFLLPAEVELMPFAARLVTFTIGLRFLADHLAGDVYFKIERPGHNLDRARVQFEMVRFMEQHETEMQVF
jgi:hypothetical protein